MQEPDIQAIVETVLAELQAAEGATVDTAQAAPEADRPAGATDSDGPQIDLDDPTLPAEYVEVPDHPLVGATLLITHEGRPAEYVVSEGGPIGVACTPRRSHYQFLQPSETYRFVFDGLQYTSFSPAELFRHRTHHWLRVAGELVAEVDYVADVHDQELQLAVWTGRIRSNQIVFRVG